MKKLLLFSMVLLTYVSYGQYYEKWDSKIENGFSKFTNGVGDGYRKLFIDNNIFDENAGFTLAQVSNGIEVEVRCNKGGGGFEVYGDYYTGIDRNGYALYYITPSIHGFDLQLGGGWINDRQTITTDYHFDWIGDLTNQQSVPTTTRMYGIIGFTKDIHIYNCISVEAKYFNRFLSNGVVGEFGVGIKIGGYSRN